MPSPQPSNPTPTQPPEDDYALMAAVARGDAAAFTRLYDCYSPIVLAICLRVLHDRQLAEDVLEEVFWELWERADRYNQERGSPRTYLLTLTRSRAIDRLRSERMHRQASVPMQHSPDLSGHDGANPSAEHNPVQDAVLREQIESMREAMANLPDKQRRAIEAAYFDGLSHREAARKLDQPLGSIKTHIRQGLIRLREMVRSLDRGGET